MPFYRLLLLAVTVVLASCASTSSNTANLAPQESALQAQVDEFPNDTLALRKLVAYQLDSFSQNPDIDLLSRVQSNLKQGLALSPTDRFYAFHYYRLNLQMAFVENRYDYAKWQSYYDQHPFLATLDLAPPMYMRHLLGPLSKAEQIAVFQQSIAANPYFISAYIELADVYFQQEQLELAIFVLESALAYSEDNAPLLSDWSHYNAAYIETKQCAGRDVSARLNKTVTGTKKLTQLNPQNDFYFIQLADLLKVQGKSTLALFAGQQAAKLDPNNNGYLLELYLWANKLDKLFAHPAATMTDNTDAETLAVLIYANIAAEKLTALPALTQAYASRDDARFYGLYYGALALSGDDIQQSQNLLQQAADRFELNPWQQSLWSYASQHIDQSQLIAEAKDLCEESEARFAIGLQQMVSGELAAAKAQWQQIQDLKVSAFYEYAVAKRLLNGG